MSYFKYYQRRRISIIIDEQTLLSTDQLNVLPLLSKSFYDRKEITVKIEDYKLYKEKYDTLFKQLSQAKRQGFVFALHYVFDSVEVFKEVNPLIANTVTVPYYEDILKDSNKIEDGRMIALLDFSYSDKEIINIFNFLSAMNMDIKISATENDVERLVSLYHMYHKIKCRNGIIFNIDAIEKAVDFKSNISSSYIPTIRLNTLDDDVNLLSLNAIEAFKLSPCNTCPVNDCCNSERHRIVSEYLPNDKQCELFKRVLIDLWTK